MNNLLFFRQLANLTAAQMGHFLNCRADRYILFESGVIQIPFEIESLIVMLYMSSIDELYCDRALISEQTISNASALAHLEIKDLKDTVRKRYFGDEETRLTYRTIAKLKEKHLNLTS